MNMLRSMAGAALLAPVLAVPGPANAADMVRTHSFNAPAHCQGALPNFEGNLRKRPLALHNEGASTAFVTCAVPTQGRVTELRVSLWKQGYDVSGTVTCTAVAGAMLDTNRYLTKSAFMYENVVGEFVFSAEDFGGGGTNFLPSSFLGVSCSLSPGTILGAFRLSYYEET